MVKYTQLEVCNWLLEKREFGALEKRIGEFRPRDQNPLLKLARDLNRKNQRHLAIKCLRIALKSDSVLPAVVSLYYKLIANQNTKAELLAAEASDRSSIMYARLNADLFLDKLAALEALAVETDQLPSTLDLLRHSIDRGEVNEHVAEFIRPLERVLTEHSEVFLDTNYSGAHRRELIEYFRSAIRSKIPFSFIRIGDGEGAFITPKGGDFKDRSLYFNMWFGKEMTHADSELLEELEVKFLANADVVGIPGIKRMFEDFSVPSSFKDRALVPIFERLKGLYRSAPSSVVLTSAFAHVDLLKSGDWALLLANLPRITVISGHKEKDLCDVLKSQWSVEVESYIQIAPEFKFRQQLDADVNIEHYPQQFGEIVEAISGATQFGKVYLIGAGFLGKYYCSLVKQNGGIALDVGSAFDYLMSFKTRRHVIN